MDNSKVMSFEGCYLFRSMTASRRNTAIASLAHTETEYADGAVIFSEDSFTPSLYYILSGNLVVSRTCNEKTVLLNRLTPGDSFGAASMFGAPTVYPTTVTANGVTRLLSVTEKDLRTLFLTFPETALAHIRFLSDRIRFLNDKIDSFSGRSAESRVAKYILSTYGKQTSHSDWNMKQTAAALDIGRASLYRIVSEFEAQKYIGLSNGQITVLNISEIERLSKKQ